MAEDQKLASASGALQNLFGTGDENVRLLEKLMDVHVALRGGDIVVEGGDEQRVDGAREILKRLCALAEKGERVDTAVVQYAVSLLERASWISWITCTAKSWRRPSAAAPSAARHWASRNMCARSAATR